MRFFGLVGALLLGLPTLAPGDDAKPLRANRWVEVRRDPAGARRGSALRYAPDAGAFVLWGFMNHDYELLQENPTMPVPEYDVVTFDPDSGRWDLHGPAPHGLDALVTTRHGVLGVTVDWPSRLNDAGYLLPWSPDLPEKDTAVYRYSVAQKNWERLGQVQSSPHNLYEMTSLAYDSQRDRLFLHGAGLARDELWAFDLTTNRWSHPKPTVAAGAAPPPCNREAVYLPGQDVLLTFGPAPEQRAVPALWAYQPGENVWRRLALAPPPGVEPRTAARQNRALV
jgi:hypothetical protein